MISVILSRARGVAKNRVANFGLLALPRHAVLRFALDDTEKKPTSARAAAAFLLPLDS